MILLQINSLVNSGSTGRIVENISNTALSEGHSSFIAFGRGNRPSTSKLIRIGNKFDVYLHGIKTLISDKHGFGSKIATEKLVHLIDNIKPDIIGLYNLHGYYLNIEVLFNYLHRKKTPVLWTLFDCWAFTGHCCYFDDITCEKYKSHCFNCPKYLKYPRSLLDNSFNNFLNKKRLFTSLDNLTIITHSHWLAGLVKQSFLKDYPIFVTPSGIDLQIFKPTESTLRADYNLKNKIIILGCADIWSARKGFQDFLKLRKLLDKSFQIVLIGLNIKEQKRLPDGITGVQRTESTIELAQWYSAADIFLNPTSQDNFPTTNIEALACATPVITYNTGGSPEAIDKNTGRVVPKSDVHGLKAAIFDLINMDRKQISLDCRKRAEEHFDQNHCFNKYLINFKNLLKK